MLLISGLTADLARQPVTAPEVSLDPDAMCYDDPHLGVDRPAQGGGGQHGSLACVISEIPAPTGSLAPTG